MGLNCHDEVYISLELRVCLGIINQMVIKQLMRIMYFLKDKHFIIIIYYNKYLMKKKLEI